MTAIELYEHQRHLSAAIQDLEARIPAMDDETKQRAHKTLDNLEREYSRTVEMSSTGIIG